MVFLANGAVPVETDKPSVAKSRPYSGLLIRVYGHNAGFRKVCTFPRPPCGADPDFVKARCERGDDACYVSALFRFPTPTYYCVDRFFELNHILPARVRPGTLLFFYTQVGSTPSLVGAHRVLQVTETDASGAHGSRWGQRVFRSDPSFTLTVQPPLLLQNALPRMLPSQRFMRELHAQDTADLLAAITRNGADEDKAMTIGDQWPDLDLPLPSRPPRTHPAPQTPPDPARAVERTPPAPAVTPVPFVASRPVEEAFAHAPIPAPGGPPAREESSDVTTSPNRQRPRRTDDELGPLKPRIKSQEKAGEIVAQLVERLGLAELRNRLDMAGVKVSGSVREIRTQFMQNAFHQGRSPQRELFASLWYEHVFSVRAGTHFPDLDRRKVDVDSLREEDPDNALARAMVELRQSVTNAVGPEDAHLFFAMLFPRKLDLMSRVPLAAPGPTVPTAPATAGPEPVLPLTTADTRSSTAPHSADSDILHILHAKQKELAYSLQTFNAPPPPDLAELGLSAVERLGAQAKGVALMVDAFAADMALARDALLQETRKFNELLRQWDEAPLPEPQEGLGDVSLREFEKSLSSFKKESAEKQADLEMREAELRNRVARLRERLRSIEGLDDRTIAALSERLDNSLQSHAESEAEQIESEIVGFEKRQLELLEARQASQERDLCVRRLEAIASRQPEYVRSLILDDIRRAAEAQDNVRLAAIETKLAQKAEPRQATDNVAQGLEVVNSFFSDPSHGGQKRSVIVVPSDDQAPLRIPICIRLGEPGARPTPLKLRIAGVGPLFQGHVYDDADDGYAVQIPAGVAQLELAVPLKVPAPARRKLADRKSGITVAVHVDGRNFELSWDAMYLRTRDSLPVNPLDVTSPSPDDVERLPLGVETLRQELLDWIGAGRGHVCLRAPRRFGKTSLIRYLVDRGARPDTTVVTADLSGHHGRRGECVRLIVSAVAKALDVREGDLTFLERWAGPGTLTQWENLRARFADLRGRAASHGHKRLVILVDEGQALFAGTEGDFSFADRMKAFLEEIATKVHNLADVRFGLFGRVATARLMGPNLTNAFVSPSGEVHEVDEAQVMAVLRQLGPEVSSTVPSRDLLKKNAFNLFLLRRILGTMRTRLIKEERNFVVAGDVEGAIEQLFSDHEVDAYLRDPLNRSDDTNRWEPVPAYPVAMALACATSGNDYAEPAQVVRELGRLVEGWGILDADIQKALSSSDLKELVEWNAGKVRLKALPIARFLRLRAQELPDRTELVECLSTLLLDEVLLPGDMEPVATGGQAELFRGEVDGLDCAIRIMGAKTSPIRFRREVEALRQIGRSMCPGDLAYGCLPDLVQAGRASGKYVVICRWVDGRDLGTFLGEKSDEPGIPPQILRAAVRDVALALGALHHEGLVHRDVKPSNIVLSSAGRAVLIDFGLVRQIGTASVLTQAGTSLYMPHKGYGEASGDIYALCASVCALLGGSEDEEGIKRGRERVRDQWGDQAAAFFAAALQPAAVNRGSAGDLAKCLAGPLPESPATDELLRTLREQFPAGPRYKELEGIRISLSMALKFGRIPERRDRVLVGAALAYDLFECLLKMRRLPTGTISLRTMNQSRDALEQAGLSFTQREAEEMSAVAELRHAYGHWNDATEKQRRAQQRLGRKQFDQAVREVLERAGGWLFNRQPQRQEFLRRVTDNLMRP